MRLDGRRLLGCLLLGEAGLLLLRSPGGAPSPGAGGAVPAGGLRVRLDPNRASEAELLLLDGLGPRRVRALVELRREGPFHGPEDLLSVPGVGPVTLERIRPDLAESFAGVRRP